jgi:hypothetical protein
VNARGRIGSYDGEEETTLTPNADAENLAEILREPAQMEVGAKPGKAC